MAKACQLFSSSKGNCILISCMGHNYLVDIGVSAKRCENALFDRGINPESIEGIFVTHEHSDHAKGIRVFASRHKTPVYAASACIDKMLLDEIINDKVNIQPIGTKLELEDTTVLTFKQSHDSVDCIGFRFNLPDNRSISVCTDTGYVTDSAKEVLEGTDMIFIESNHEISMVQTGPYSYNLKQRILGVEGHLSNFACAEYIKQLAKSGTTRFVLSHLSEENNMPDIARQTAICALGEIGLEENIDYRLYVSPTESYDKGISL